MAEVICNTSPLQYLHQLGLLHILPSLAGRVVVPPAVVAEIEEGQRRGVNLPHLAEHDWVKVRKPSCIDALHLVFDLGHGETQVLALALESPGSVVVLDDALARRVAESLNLPFTGTLGLLLDVKRAGIITAVNPSIDLLQTLGFRLAPQTPTAVLKLAGEII